MLLRLRIGARSASLSAVFLFLSLTGTTFAADGGMESPPSLEKASSGTAFTYQGHLLLTGSPANGLFDFQFRLMDASSDGAQVGSTVLSDNVPVAEGRFTVNLDFGSLAFGGGARWLEISVREDGAGSYTLLDPRQKLTPAPQALSLPNVYTNESANFVGVGRPGQLTTTERFGVHAETTGNIYGGMYVDTSDADGRPFYGYGTGGSYRAWTYYNGITGEWTLNNGGDRISVPSGGGLVIENTTETDGIQINSTLDDGIQIGSGSSYPNYGVYVQNVSATALLVFTSNAQGDYALYTTDNIQAGTVNFSAQRMLARVDASSKLEPGDVVAATGVGEPLKGGSDRLASLSLATSEATGVVGVVASRMEWQLAPGKEAEGERILMPVGGPAKGGDIVAVVTQGVADVRVQSGAQITRGARLTAFESAGKVRPLRVESLNGMPVTEGAPVVGVALAESGGGDTVPVYVDVH